MVDYDSAPKQARDKFDYEIKHNGRITNMKKTLLHSIPAYTALMQWYPLRDEASKFLSNREINFFCYAISTQNDCLICSTFFMKILKDLDINFDNFEFTMDEQLLIDYGRELVVNPNSISEEVFKKLKAKYSEEQIVVITSFGALMIATNLINNSLDVELDEYLWVYRKDDKDAK
jgi:hypothetical protein